MVCADGTASSTSRFSACSFVLVCTSTTGEAPATVTVSSTAPTLMSAFIVAVKCFIDLGERGAPLVEMAYTWAPIAGSSTYTVAVDGRGT